MGRSTDHTVAALLPAWLLVLATTGCTLMEGDPIPHDGPSMREIYETHMGGGSSRDGAPVGQGLRERALASGTVDQEAYTRTAGNEIDTRFARLPNPDLVMFVFPHLAGPSRSPVPGYSSVIPMYRQPAYALPGETVAY